MHLTALSRVATTALPHTHCKAVVPFAPGGERPVCSCAREQGFCRLFVCDYMQAAALRCRDMGAQFVLLGSGGQDGGLKRMSENEFRDHPDIKVLIMYRYVCLRVCVCVCVCVCA